MLFSDATFYIQKKTFFFFHRSSNYIGTNNQERRYKINMGVVKSVELCEIVEREILI